jgi:hypothetical protein
MRAAEVRLAYPVVQLKFPGVTLSQWLDFARMAARPANKKSGLVAVRDSRKQIHAVFRYRIEKDLQFQVVLKISNLIIARLPGRGLGAAVIEIVDALARESRCQAVSLELTGENEHGETGQSLRSTGYSANAVSVLRCAEKLRPTGVKAIKYRKRSEHSNEEH